MTLNVCQQCLNREGFIIFFSLLLDWWRKNYRFKNDVPVVSTMELTCTTCIKYIYTNQPIIVFKGNKVYGLVAIRISFTIHVNNSQFKFIVSRQSPAGLQG